MTVDYLLESTTLSSPASHTVENDFSRTQESGDTQATPTQLTYLGWDQVSDYFNRKLFEGRLPLFLITYQRNRSCYGFFSAERFVGTGTSRKRIHEIALNPQYFATLTTVDALSVLVHEMCHLARFHLYSPKPTAGYHDGKWSAIMRNVGLIPSTTGTPGGKETGYRVSHYIDESGPFFAATQELLRQGFRIHFVETASTSAAGADGKPLDEEALAEAIARKEARRAKKNASKTRFRCPAAHENAWAREQAKLVCGHCGEPMTPAAGNGHT